MTRTNPTSAYLDACRTDQKMANAVRSIQLPGGGARFPGIALPRPMFIASSTVKDMSKDIHEILDIVESIPERCFAGDVESYMMACGTQPDLIEIINRGSIGTSVRYARADVLKNGDDLYVIELNVGSELGGMGVPKLNRGLLRNPVFREFAESHGLEYIDMVSFLAGFLRHTAKDVVGTTEPMVAIVEENGADLGLRWLAEDLRNYELSVVIGELGDLSVENGKILMHGNTRIDVVLRYFYIEHLLADSDGARYIEMLTRAHLDGQTALFTSLDAAVHEDKGALAMLYEPDIWSDLSIAERALITRRVPWSRKVGPRLEKLAPEDRKQLIDRCQVERAELVLKPAWQSNSVGVVFGSDMTDNDWLSALHTCDSVVQRRITPESEDIVDPDTGATEPWHVNWGIYANAAGYGGMSIRARRAADNGVIGGSLDHTRPGCAFTY